MISFKNIPWKKRFFQACWIIIGIGTMVLFGAAMLKKSTKTCTNIQVEIAGAEQHMFLDEKDILALINSKQTVIGAATTKTNLQILEHALEQNYWVHHAELYFDNNQVLKVHIQERQPIARVFLINGGSFYVDSTGLRLPLSDKLSAKVPVFTNFPSDRPILAKPDSVLLNGIVLMAKTILADSFWTAQVQQVNIDPQQQFEIVPLIGKQLILVGDIENLESKFKRLHAFYEQALVQQGINKYAKLDLRFNNQVVASLQDSIKIYNKQTDKPLTLK